MSRRVVAHVRVDDSGVVTLVCNPNEWWSPVSATELRIQLSGGGHTYFTVATDRTTARIRVDSAGLLTAVAKDGSNHFAVLPRC